MIRGVSRKFELCDEHLHQPDVIVHMFVYMNAMNAMNGVRFHMTIDDDMMINHNTEPIADSAVSFSEWLFGRYDLNHIKFINPVTSCLGLDVGLAVLISWSVSLTQVLENQYHEKEPNKLLDHLTRL